MADRGRAPGLTEVVLVALGIVAVVLGAAFLTGLLPAEARDLVVDTPVAILVLVGGTALVLWRVARRPGD